MDGPSVENRELTSWGNSPYGETNIGRCRKENQDAVLQIDQIIGPYRQRVFAVADGVATIEGSAQASQLLLSNISERIKRGQNIDTNSLFEINQQLDKGATTLVLAQAFGDKNTFKNISVGDSSAYVMDTKHKQIALITRRDSIKLENGQSKVTQIMGLKNSRSSLKEPYIFNVILKPYQSLLLATDGLTGYMDKGLITNSDILKLKTKYQEDNRSFVKSLIDLANGYGGGDNITIVSIPYEK